MFTMSTWKRCESVSTDLDRFVEFDGMLLFALDVEGHHATVTDHLSLSYRILRMRFQT